MLNPLLLWFLPLALVPIILHLVTLHRLPTIELSTFRFLMDSHVQQRRRVRLLEFILMLLRTAFVVLIIVTLSRPVIQKFGWLFGGQTGRDVTIILDSGSSMELRSGGTTCLERARAAASTIVHLLGKQDHVTLIRASQKPDVLIRGFAGQSQRILDALESIEADATTSDIAMALTEAMAGPSHGPRVVYVLSNAQHSGWTKLLEHPVLKVMANNTRIAVMNVGPAEPITNLAVVGESPDDLRPVVGLPVILNAHVVNHSSDRSVDTILSVKLDGEQVHQAILRLQPGQRAMRTITVTPNRPGLILGQFSLPSDTLTADDTYLFCLNVEPKLGVLIVTPSLSVQDAKFAGLYLRSTLASPLLAQSGSKPDDHRLAELLAVKTVPQDKLNRAMLDQADVVILADATLTVGKSTAVLRQYVENGGGLLLLPGSHVNPEHYRQYLLEGADADDSAASVRFDPYVGDPEDEASFVSLAGVKLTHPVFSAFNDTGADYFSTVRFYRYFPLRLTEATIPHRFGPKVLMRLADESAVMVETRLGAGKILVAGFPATPDWSNLPLKPEFVPMLLRAVAYLRRAAMVEVPASVRPHQPAPVRVTDRWPQAAVQVIDPTGRPHTIKMHQAGRHLLGAMLQTDRKGCYTVQVFPGKIDDPGIPEKLEMGFAVNLQAAQAGLALLDEHAIRALFEPLEIVYLHGSPEDPLLGEQLTYKRELWRMLIWITFAVIGVEFLVATLRPRRDTEDNFAGSPSSLSQRWGRRLAKVFVYAGLPEPLVRDRN